MLYNILTNKLEHSARDYKIAANVCCHLASNSGMNVAPIESGSKSERKKTHIAHINNTNKLFIDIQIKVFKMLKQTITGFVLFKYVIHVGIFDVTSMPFLIPVATIFCLSTM